jgi:hypothetical protein
MQFRLEDEVTLPEALTRETQALELIIVFNKVNVSPTEPFSVEGETV